MSINARTYSLQIIQHPSLGAASGCAEISRLPLSPPLVAQLITYDSMGRIVENDPEHPCLVAHLSLCTPDGCVFTGHGNSVSNKATERQLNRALHGSTVSSPYYVLDMYGRDGIFFVFPDVTVRLEGRYTLCVSLSDLLSS
ncbi:hypothetical protein BV25DRAFT_1799942 [Artomyces pyxidatus]|uniref:Uncharacterized protein n=1 Tax=Artomyces pyxidatus TaxID=48021 RepID=A0ACB8T9Z5_9AGAM|nr:hypothetical protein BV25DRAFT_1799942 [Artomyces pyxidatus]